MAQKYSSKENQKNNTKQNYDSIVCLENKKNKIMIFLCKKNYLNKMWSDEREDYRWRSDGEMREKERRMGCCEKRKEKG